MGEGDNENNSCYKREDGAVTFTVVARERDKLKKRDRKHDAGCKREEVAHEAKRRLMQNPYQGTGERPHNRNQQNENKSIHYNKLIDL